VVPTSQRVIIKEGMPESILVLLAAGADAKIKNKRGKTSLDLAQNYAKLLDTGYVTTKIEKENFKNTYGYMALEKQ